MSIWIFAIGAGLLVSIISLVGVLALLMQQDKLQKILHYLVSLAVGVLLGEAFLHLIPDSLQQIGSMHTVSLLIMAGILLFFLLEKVVRWRHQHSIVGGADKVLPVARMNILGDALHNFIDGTLIASSFLVSPTLGWTATAAIIAHEIPQEIGDMGILIYSGYSVRRAVLLNFLCSLTCVLGVGITLVLGKWLLLPTVYLVPLAAGGFIYIAASDMVPELHKETDFTAQYGQGLVLAMGAGLMHFVGVIEGLMK